MASKMIGIEFGSAELRLSLATNGNITATASARIPQGLVVDGRVTEPATMAELLRDTMAARGIRGKACVLVLPPQIVTAQHLSLPVMSRAELKLNLPFEFRDILTGELTDYDHDYIVQSIDESEMKLYAAAVLRSATEEYQKIIKMAGLRLKAAFPAELIWLELLRSKNDLPRNLGILALGQSSHRLSIYADGRFITGKELPCLDQRFAESVPDIQRAINLYNFSLPMGEAPMKDIILVGDTPDTASEDLTAMDLHPISRLIKGIQPQFALSAAAALQKEAHRPQNGPGMISPDKQTMELVRVQKDLDHRKMLPMMALLAAASIGFAYFGILIPLNEKTQAYNSLAQRQEQLADANARLLGYDQVEQDFLRYSDALMTEAEVSLVDRAEILELVRSVVMPMANIQDIMINGNNLTMELSGITLEKAGVLMETLEACDLVKEAGILSATADDNDQAHILISIILTAGHTEGGASQ